MTDYDDDDDGGGGGGGDDDDDDDDDVYCVFSVKVSCPLYVQFCADSPPSLLCQRNIMYVRDKSLPMVIHL